MVPGLFGRKPFPTWAEAYPTECGVECPFRKFNSIQFLIAERPVMEIDGDKHALKFDESVFIVNVHGKEPAGFVGTLPCRLHRSVETSC